jgi:hypothetical protein
MVSHLESSKCNLGVVAGADHRPRRPTASARDRITSDLDVDPPDAFSYRKDPPTPPSPGLLFRGRDSNHGLAAYPGHDGSAPSHASSACRMTPANGSRSAAARRRSAIAKSADNRTLNVSPSVTLPAHNRARTCSASSWLPRTNRETRFPGLTRCAGDLRVDTPDALPQFLETACPALPARRCGRTHRSPRRRAAS